MSGYRPAIQTLSLVVGEDDLSELMGLASADNSLARTAHEMPLGLLRVSRDGILLFANMVASKLLPLAHLSLGEPVSEEWCTLIELAFETNGKIKRDWRHEDKTFEMSLTADGGTGADFVDIYTRDVTALRATEKFAQRAAYHDTLTGLANRTLFQTLLTQMVGVAERKQTSLAVHIISLSGVMDINQTKGHQTGDKFIGVIAERLTSLVGSEDAVARLSGIQFAIIQWDAKSRDDVDELANRVFETISNPIVIDDDARHVGVRMGVAVYPEPGVTDKMPHELIRRAEIALGYAKAENDYGYRFYETQMNDEIERRHAIEAELAVAIENDELELHFQPKLNLSTGRIGGMEALVRWMHPERGFMSPAEFIPIAEKSSLIIPLGRWVLFDACRRAKEWNDNGLGPLKIAVNLSAVQFGDEGLIDDIERTLRETGLEAKYLELEITETVAMDDADTAAETFEKIAALGVSLSIDDFGTGYSSLSYLKSFPVQRIKIDKAFVDDISAEEDSGVIARAVTTMGHSFGMDITAEGVETEEQMDFLGRLNCEEVQGYYFSKPLPAAQFETFTRNFIAAA